MIKTKDSDESFYMLSNFYGAIIIIFIIIDLHELKLNQ